MNKKQIITICVIIFVAIFVAILAVIGLALLSSGNVYLPNYKVFDTVYTFDRAIISVPGGDVVKGAVESWKDWDDSDMIQVEIDGVTYYTHASNVLLIEDR